MLSTDEKENEPKIQRADLLKLSKITEHESEQESGSLVQEVRGTKNIRRSYVIDQELLGLKIMDGEDDENY